MKILFIHENNYFEPLGLMCLSAALKQQGHNCFFLDLAFEKSPGVTVRALAPDIVAYSVTTADFERFRKINSFLKTHQRFFAVFGGPHATFFPNIIRENDIDAICIGEGEKAFVELADCMESGISIENIDNFWIKQEGKIFKNGVRNLIDNLDSLPAPDRDLISVYPFYRKMRRRYIISGRGCPYQCTYCFNHAYNKLYNNKGNIVRKRSVGKVIEELKSLKDKFRPKRFQFVDDIFIIKRKWTLEFCRTYKEEVGLPFIANMRVNHVNDEVAAALREAGCITAVLAIESGNEHIRNQVLKRNTSERQIVDAANCIKRNKIKIYAQGMIGLPDETVETAHETLALFQRCDVSYSWVSIFQPYPKTTLRDYAIEKGYLPADDNSFHENYYKRSPLELKDKKKLERLHHLFTIGVEFPVLGGLLKTLCHIPLDPFYYLIWHFHRAYCYFFRVRWIDPIEILYRFMPQKRRSSAD